MKTRDYFGYSRSLGRLCLSLILVFLMLLSAALPGQARAAGSRRRIHVVFDDSSSMGNDKRWSRAMYALEVFAAMLEPDDELKVYALNSSGTLETNGKDSSRVQKVYQWGKSQITGTTPFDKVRKAAQDLISIKTQYSDCWLVVLTDGGFDERYLSNDLAGIFDDWNGQGIKTIYMGISSSAMEVRSNTSRGAYSYKAANSQAVLSQLRDIANRIFERLILPADHFQRSGNTYTLNIDVPTSDIIVFAQGDNARIGNLMISGQAKQPTELLDVQYAEHPSFGEPDKELKGVVAVYHDSPAAVMTIDVADCTEVEFYYNPAVDVDCELTQDGKVIEKDSEILEGQYHVTGAFTDPATGKRIQSSLLDESAIVLTLDNNGTVYNFGVSGGDVDLKIGNVKVTATADLKTTTLSTTKNYVVKKSEGKLEQPPIEGIADSIRQDQLKGNKTIVYVVQIVDAETRQPVDEERWKESTLEIPDQHGIHWEWTKDGMDSPLVKLIPSAVGKYSDVDLGALQFSAAVISGPNVRTDNTFLYTVNPFEPFRVESVTKQVNQKALKDRSDVFTVHLLDPYNNDRPITGDRWAAVKDLTVTDGNGIIWDIQRGPGEGEYSLTPASADGKMRSVNPGTYTFTVEGTYDDGDLMDWKTQETLTVEVIKHPEKPLDIQVDVPQDPFPQSRFHMKDSEPIIVTAMCQGAVIPDRVWQLTDETRDISVTLDDPDQKLEFEIRKGVKTGTWEIQPLPQDGKGYRTSTGRIRFHVSVDILDDEDLYYGTAPGELHVEPELIWVIWEWILDNLWWLIPALLLLFYLIAYQFPKKKHLRTGKYKLLFTYDGEDGIRHTMVKIQKVRSSVLIPFKAQKARLNVKKESFMCHFPNVTIQSAGKSWLGKDFIITPEGLNMGMDMSPYTVGNRTFDKMEEIVGSRTADPKDPASRPQSFALAGFSIETEGEAFGDMFARGTVEVVDKSYNPNKERNDA